MSQAGLESFGAYQKERELFDTYYLERISVSTQAEQAGAFSRPFGTCGSQINAFPGLKAWAIFDCPSGTCQNEMRSGTCQNEMHPMGPTRDCTGIFLPLHSTLDPRPDD